MPARAKRISLITLAISWSITALIFGPLSWAALIGGFFIAGVALYIAHIPVLENKTAMSPPSTGLE